MVKKIFLNSILLGMLLYASVFIWVYPGGSAEAEEYIPGHLGVNFKDQYLPVNLQISPDRYVVSGYRSLDSLNQVYGCYKYRRIAPHLLPGLYLFYFPDTLDMIQLTGIYSTVPHLEYVELDYPMIFFSNTPNDSLFPRQWAHDSVHMQSELGWAIATGYTDIIVEIEDSGVDWMHPDLDSNIWINSAEDINHNGRFDTLWVSQGGDIDSIDQDGNGFLDDIVGWDFKDHDYDPHCEQTYGYDHGDGTAGTALAKTHNVSGGAGTSWHGKIMIARGVGLLSGGIDGIDYAVANGADIINMSWGSVSACTSQSLQRAIDAAYDSGLVLVAAAGNDTSMIQCPAALQKVIAVAATDINDCKYPYSVFGIHIDLSAPGDNWFPCRDSTNWNLFTYMTSSGTSLSAPLVSGLAALIKGQHISLWGPNSITNSQVETVLDSSCDSIYHLPGNAPYIGKLGAGRINTFKALLAISRGEVNNDHQVDMADVISLAKYCQGYPGYDPIPVPEMGDVNCDGQVGLSDVIYLTKYLNGQYPKPPSCFKYKYPWN
jgi:subtilisin family serine protease